jgi:hypothetical protein
MIKLCSTLAVYTVFLAANLYLVVYFIGVGLKQVLNFKQDKNPQAPVPKLPITLNSLKRKESVKIDFFKDLG